MEYKTFRTAIGTTLFTGMSLSPHLRRRFTIWKLLVKLSRFGKSETDYKHGCPAVLMNSFLPLEESL